MTVAVVPRYRSRHRDCSNLFQIGQSVVMRKSGDSSGAEPVLRDPRWALIEEARPALLDALQSQGVVRIEVVAMFPYGDNIAIWLCTATDEQRDALPASNPYVDEVRTILLATGFSAEQVRQLMTVAQSQETVDRDYEGSWFYALR